RSSHSCTTLGQPRIGGSFTLAWPRLGQQQAKQCQSAKGQGGETAERYGAAKPVDRVARECGAKRSTDTDRAADHSQSEIEPSRCPGDVSDHQWQQHTQNGCTHAIENLDDNHEIRVCDESK